MNDRMQLEWNAWQQVCRQLRALGVEPNDKASNPLMGAIRLWGEEVAALRSEQDPEVVAGALQEYRDNYRRYTP